jgi:2-iminobutanoate/2-iminopropanoate deaminase
MQRTKVQTAQAPAAIGPYSQAIRCGQFLYTSGQVALDPASGELVGADFLASMGDFQAMNAVYARYFEGPGRLPPARSTVAVAELPRKALVEIECVAILEE